MTRSPTIEWQACGVCNYDCSYCIQSKVYRVGHPSDEEVTSFIDFFAALKGRWEIKMTGGEPFAFRGYMQRIIPELVAKTSHTISTLTNLSAPQSILERFVELTRGRLGVVSASLHLEHVAVEEFVQKAVWLKDHIDPSARLVINSVMVPGRLHEFAEAKARVEEAGLHLFPQAFKTKGGVHAYEGEQDLVVSLVGRRPTPRDANMAPNYRGRTCWTGVEYFVVMQNGDTWSCRTAKRHKEGYLGNVIAGTVALRTAPVPCAYDICPCTVPANRGMIEGLTSGATIDD